MRLKEAVKSFLNIDEPALAMRHKLQIPLREIRRLKNNPEAADTDSVLFGKEIRISHHFWHLHSIQEIFLDEVYKFNCQREHPLIIDCGANIGLSAIYFKKRFPLSRIIAFEPDPEIFQKLKHNIGVFGYTTIELHNEAVWTSNEILSFKSSGALGGTLEIDQVPEASHGNPAVPVSATRLKDYLLEPVDFLKIDIEGAEMEVVADCSESLMNVSHLFIEYHSAPGKEQQLHKLLQIIRQAGFRYYLKEAWNNLPHPYLAQDSRPFWDLQLNIFAYRP